MIFRKFFSAVLLLFGLGLFIFGSNMADQAAQGEMRISQAEENVQDQRRPVLGPVRRNVREQATENAQEKINTAGQNIVASQVTANWLRGTGLAIFIIGMGGLIFCFTRKND